MSLDNEISSVDAAETPDTPTAPEAVQEPVDVLSSDGEAEELETQLALQNLEKRRKDKRRKRNLKILVACALAGGILAAVLGHGFNTEPELPEEEDMVETAVVERRDFQNVISASGALKAGSTTVVSPEVDGVIESVQVTEGQAVEKGDVLFTIKNELLDKEIRAAQESIDEALQAVADAQSEVTDACNERDEEWDKYYEDYADYQADYKAWTRERKSYSKQHKAWEKRYAAAEKLKVAEPTEPTAPTPPELDLIEDEQAKADAQANYEEQLAQYQEDYAEYQTNYAAYQKYQAALLKVGEEPELSDEPVAPEEPDDSALQSAIKSAQSGVTEAQKGVKEAREAYDEKVKEAEGRTVKAPCSGNIVALNAQVGASTLGSGGEGEGAGDELAKISNMKEMAVDIEVNEIDILNVKVGQKATVTFSAVRDATCEAVVNEVSTVASGEGGDGGGIVTFHVGLTIPKPDERLRAGMTANVEILTIDEKDVLVVPTSAVSEGAAGASVEVVLDEASLETDEPDTEIREVTLGTRSSSEVVVTDGLEEGEMVLLSGGMDDYYEEEY